MATSAAAALLDELMGRSRNCDPSEKPAELHWEDDVVCKHYLCAFCPNEVFTNTRADLGICNKVHDEAIRKMYQESSRFEKMGYEEEFMKCLQNIISEVEKKIRRGHQRLALSAQGTLNGGLQTEKDEKINMLTEKINELVEQAEELGSEGKVEEAQGVLKLCDQLKVERSQCQNQTVKEDIPQMKQMEVCEVCGAFLIVDDAPQRQEEHLTGRQHAGYAQVRAEIEKRKMLKRTEQEERERKKQEEREEQERAAEREREERRRREKEREDRDRRDRDRERDRDRDRRRRSRSRSRGRRSRSRDRRRSRSRSRDRRRSRDRKRRSESRSDRSRSSRSSHRSRSRSRDRESSSSRRHRDRRKEDRDRRSRSRTRDREKENGGGGGSSGSSSRASKDRHSPSAPPTDGSASQSQGDTKTD